MYKAQIVCLSLELECEKNENEQKEAGIGPFFKKLYISNTVQFADWIQKVPNLRILKFYKVNKTS